MKMKIFDLFRRTKPSFVILNEEMISFEEFKNRTVTEGLDKIVYLNAAKQIIIWKPKAAKKK